MHISKQDIDGFDHKFRKSLINSLAGFRQAVLVGTKSTCGNTNLAIFNSLMHIGSKPALYGLINRPDSVQRDTLQNIRETNSYTLNFIQSQLYKKAHQTGLAPY
jgi:flavin reductase (DIM6/NTAB) family NADH-FMN oxidoreductase RutF